MFAKTLWNLIKETGNAWFEDKASRLAASLAYYTAISLAPVLVLSVTLLKFITPNSKAVVEGQMGALMGPVGKQAATTMIDAAKTQSGLWATIIGFAVLLFGASGVFAELQDAMNTVWEVMPRPGMGWWETIKKRFFSLAMVFGVSFMLLVSLIISTTLEGLANRVAGDGAAIEVAVDIVLSLLVYSLLFALIFRFLPDVKIKFADVWLGAIATAVLFTAGKYLLTLYLTKGSTASAYGAAGSLAALLIWVYYSAQILFFGAEFTRVYARCFGSGIRPDEQSIAATPEARGQQGLPQKSPPETVSHAH